MSWAQWRQILLRQSCCHIGSTDDTTGAFFVNVCQHRSMVSIYSCTILCLNATFLIKLQKRISKSKFQIDKKRLTGNLLIIWKLLKDVSLLNATRCELSHVRLFEPSGIFQKLALHGTSQDHLQRFLLVNVLLTVDKPKYHHHCLSSQNKDLSSSLFKKFNSLSKKIKPKSNDTPTTISPMYTTFGFVCCWWLTHTKVQSPIETILISVPNGTIIEYYCHQMGSTKLLKTNINIFLTYN